MNDAELILKIKAARKAAHEAPLAEVTYVNKNGTPTGEKFIAQHTRAWADRSNEWSLLSDECERRGLVVNYNEAKE